jgi:hypothetical protein
MDESNDLWCETGNTSWLGLKAAPSIAIIKFKMYGIME